MSPRSNPESRQRKRILAAARRLLAEGGYDGLSMRRLAVILGCSAASLYRHFEDRQALKGTLADGALLALGAHLSAQRPESSPAEQLQAVFRASVRYGLERPHQQALLMRPPAAAPPGQAIDPRHPAGVFAAVLSEGRRSGAFTLSDPASTALWCWACAHGTFQLIAAGHLSPGLSPEDLIDTAAGYLLRAVA